MPQCKHRANRHMMGTKVFIEIAIFMEGRKHSWRVGSDGEPWRLDLRKIGLRRL